jgi:hypothetical protein
MTLLTPAAVGALSNKDLLAHVQAAAQNERQATAHLIALLIELDTRRLYLSEGFSSLFSYCTQALHLSEHAAYNRIETARAARRFPVLLALVSQGAVTLTAVRLLSPHLTGENHRSVLERACHKSKREVELLVARLSPQPDAPSILRKLPGRENAATAEAKRSPSKEYPLPTSNVDMPGVVAPPVTVPTSPTKSDPVELRPLTAERYKVQFTVSRDTYEKLRRTQDLLRHAIPNGDPAVIFERAIAMLLTHLERRKASTTERPRRTIETANTSRRIPAAVKRSVWKRDGGQCAFQGSSGRCTETGFLEYHHLVPFAVGGDASTSNIELRCRAHNQYEAHEYFGHRQAPLLREERARCSALGLVPERVHRTHIDWLTGR